MCAQGTSDWFSGFPGEALIQLRLGEAMSQEILPGEDDSRELMKSDVSGMEERREAERRKGLLKGNHAMRNLSLHRAKTKQFDAISLGCEAREVGKVRSW